MTFFFRVLFHLNNLLVLGQGNRFVFVEVDIDDSVIVIIKEIVIVNFAVADTISVGGVTIGAISVGLGISLRGGSSVFEIVEAFVGNVVDSTLLLFTISLEADKDDGNNG